MNWYLLFNFLSSNIFGYCYLPNISFKCFLKKFKWFIIVILMNILIKISGPFNFRRKTAGDMRDYAEILWWNVSSKLKTKFDFIEVFLFYSLSNFQKYAHNFEKFNWFQWSLTCYASNSFLRQKMTLNIFIIPWEKECTSETRPVWIELSQLLLYSFLTRWLN